MRFGVMLSMPGDPVTTAGLTMRARDAEARGFASGWLPQVGTVDALMSLAMAGADTRRIELGTAVVPTYPRHPTALAMQALTAQDATGNRIALGIGLSHRFFIEDALGMDYSQPIPHMREYLTVLNGLLRGAPVKFEGEHYRVNTQLGVAGAQPPPIIVAALGPAMLRLCGRLADGTITWMGGLNYLRDVAVPGMNDAARAAGRPAPRIVAMVPVLLANSVLEGREIVDATFRMYGQIPSYRATLERGGAAAPSDVAVVGDASDIEAGVRAFAEVGVTDFVAAIPRQDEDAVQRTMDTLAGIAMRTGA